MQKKKGKLSWWDKEIKNQYFNCRGRKKKEEKVGKAKENFIMEGERFREGRNKERKKKNGIRGRICIQAALHVAQIVSGVCNLNQQLMT